MKFCQYLVVLLLISLLAAPAAADPIGGNDQEVQAAAEPLLDAVLKGFNTGDYGIYSRYFDDTLKEAVSEKKFLQVRGEIHRNICKYQSRRYLGFLKKSKTTVVLWKGVFDNTTDDVLIKLVVSRRGDRNLVLGLWFQ